MLALLVSLVAASAVPQPVQSFLRSNPEFRLLSPADLTDFGPVLQQVSAFDVGDANGDGKRDVVAVVVRRVDGHDTPSVIAFHGYRSGYGPVVWVLRDHQHVVTGVDISRRHRIIVWECMECDSSPWFRWNGQRYEEALWARGDMLEVAPDMTAEVFDRPDPAGTPVAQLPAATELKVLAAGPELEPGRRWYRVQAKLRGRVIDGFVDARVLYWNYPREW